MRLYFSNKTVAKSATANTGDQPRDIALLIIAVCLVVIYFLKEFYISKEPAQLPPISYAEQTIIEIEDVAGVSKVYELPGKQSEVKSGSKIKINRDGSANVGLISGEKHLIFSIPLDINKATTQDFEALPGIGPKLAEEIVATQQRLGGFKTVDDLKKVKGIGDKKFEKIREMISIE